MKPFLHRLGSTGLAAILLPVLLFAACDKESHAGATNPPTTSSTPSVMDKAKAGLADFQKSTSEALSSVDQKLADLKTKAASATESTKVELDEALAKLDAKRQEVGNRLSELKNEAPDKIQVAMDKVKSELADLKKSTEDALAKFK
jgi:uncharacterized protein YicC (UPF0701 family)